jgi:beta-lactamase regulating signal transducer with metallopeptidase domain
MTALYDSPFLIALGWTIASSLWQTALLWLIYQIINSANGKILPALKHSVATLFLCISFVWFAVTFVQNYNEVATLKQSLQNVANSNITLAQTLFSISIAKGLGSNYVTTVFNNFLPYLSAAYLIILLVLLIKLTRAYLFSVKLKTQGLIEPALQWIQFVDKYALHIGIKRKIKVLLSQKIDVPATLSFFKPVILLPVATLNHLTVQQVESVLLHELAHIRRNDYLINIAVAVIETVLFFNPFVYLLAKSLKKEREHCCDDLVLQYTFNPYDYASALLSLEKMRIGIQPLAVAATGESGQLLNRVKRIMNVKNSHFNYGQKLIALLITAFMLLSLAWLLPSSDQHFNNNNKPTTTTEYTRPKTLNITKKQTVASTVIKNIPTPKNENSKMGKDKNHVVANAITVDSILSVVSSMPEDMPFAAPLPHTHSVDKKNIFAPQLSEINAQKNKTAASKNIDLNFNNDAAWEQLQNELENSSAINLSEIDKNLKLIVNDNTTFLKDVFQNNQKRQVAEKYLQQLLQKNINQKEINAAQEKLFAQQKKLNIEFESIRKAQNQADSINTKSIKRKTIQKTIWI